MKKSVIGCIFSLIFNSSSCNTNVDPYSATSMDGVNSTLGFTLGGRGYRQHTGQYLGPPRTEIICDIEIEDGTTVFYIGTPLQSEPGSGAYSSNDRISLNSIWLRIPLKTIEYEKEYVILTAQSFVSLEILSIVDGYMRSTEWQMAPITTMTLIVEEMTKTRVKGRFIATLEVLIDDQPTQFELENGVFNVKQRGSKEDWHNSIDYERRIHFVG